MTNYSDAINAGYKPGDIKWQRGYISRKTNVLDHPVHVAGGSRKGQLYVLLPCSSSTNYCYRQYLTK